MATATTLIPIEQYLRTPYHPDRDYVDGEIHERTLGEREHNRLQIVLGAWFLAHEKAWGIYVLPEQRTRVSSSRVRVPDVCLLRADAPYEQVTVTPPLLCIENPLAGLRRTPPPRRPRRPRDGRLRPHGRPQPLDP